MPYCTNCGEESKSRVCINCGVKNNRVHNYCYWCGEKLNAHATICPSCQEPIKKGCLKTFLVALSVLWFIFSGVMFLGYAFIEHEFLLSLLFLLSGIFPLPIIGHLIKAATYSQKQKKILRFALNTIRIVLVALLFVLAINKAIKMEESQEPSNSNELSSYTYDEYVMYSNMTIGYSYVLDALKNPKSAEFLGISYNPEANVAYFCVLAENDFGGTTKSYISYSAKYDSISESDDLKYDYDSAEIKRTLNDLYAFMEAIENADESDVPTPTVNEALDAYSKSDREMYELIIAGIDELSVLYDDLLIIGHKYSTDTKDAYFYFTGEDFGGTPVMTYASYSDGLGLMPSDAYKALYENADIEVYSFEIAEYEEAIKKDISK